MSVDARLAATVTTVATQEWNDRVERDCKFCGHGILPGDLIHLVQGLGWCCDGCAKAEGQPVGCIHGLPDACPKCTPGLCYGCGAPIPVDAAMCVSCGREAVER